MTGKASFAISTTNRRLHEPDSAARMILGGEIKKEYIPPAARQAEWLRREVVRLLDIYTKEAERIGGEIVLNQGNGTNSLTWDREAEIAHLESVQNITLRFAKSLAEILDKIKGMPDYSDRETNTIEPEGQTVAEIKEQLRAWISHVKATMPSREAFTDWLVKTFGAVGLAYLIDSEIDFSDENDATMRQILAGIWRDR